MIRYFCDGCKVEHQPHALRDVRLSSGSMLSTDVSMMTERHGHYCEACLKAIKVFMGSLHHTATTQATTIEQWSIEPGPHGSQQ